jgi:DNA-directed RNA polymerase subunit RPC12/RpoP
VLLEKTKYCSCPHCGCKSFKDVSIVNVVVSKDEWNDEFLSTVHETTKFKCARCGKEFTGEELQEHYNKE